MPLGSATRSEVPENNLDLDLGFLDDLDLPELQELGPYFETGSTSSSATGAFSFLDGQDGLEQSELRALEAFPDPATRTSSSSQQSDPARPDAARPSKGQRYRHNKKVKRFFNPSFF